MRGNNFLRKNRWWVFESGVLFFWVCDLEPCYLGTYFRNPLGRGKLFLNVKRAFEFAHEHAHEGIAPVGFARNALENDFFQRSGNVGVAPARRQWAGKVQLARRKLAPASRREKASGPSTIRRRRRRRQKYPRADQSAAVAIAPAPCRRVCRDSSTFFSAFPEWRRNQ